jgi:hypothetical protein
MPGGPWLLPEFAETPRFFIDRKLGRPRDLESADGVFLVSPAMNAVLEAIDPDACEGDLWRTRTGNMAMGHYARFSRAVDETASVELTIKRDPPDYLPLYDVNSSTKLRFIPEVIGNAHLFHIAEMARYVFCDEIVKDACKAAGLKDILFPARE